MVLLPLQLLALALLLVILVPLLLALFPLIPPLLRPVLLFLSAQVREFLNARLVEAVNYCVLALADEYLAHELLVMEGYLARCH